MKRNLIQEGAIPQAHKLSFRLKNTFFWKILLIGEMNTCSKKKSERWTAIKNMFGWFLHRIVLFFLKKLKRIKLKDLWIFSIRIAQKQDTKHKLVDSQKRKNNGEDKTTSLQSDSPTS